MSGTHEPVTKGSKSCKWCHIVKPYVDFYPDRTRSDGRHGACKECHKAKHREYRAVPENRARLNAVSRQWRLDNPERSRFGVRNATLKKKYGIGVAEYEQMLAAQGGACAICRSTTARIKDRAFHVDHCHVTGKVRGLLCQGCNTSIGQFGDNPDLLLAAAEYVEAHRVSS